MGLIISFQTSCQDYHFSQFNASPLNLNPALAGSINGKSRIIANYRNQWSQILGRNSYQTYALSYDRRQNLKSEDYFGLGLSYYGDVSGSTRFSTIQLALSCSYARTLSKSNTSTHSLIGGLQFGLAQRKIDQSSLRWPIQNNIHYPSGFVTNPDFLYSDFNGGLVWVSRFGERKSFHAGFSAFYINRPNISFQINSIQSMSIKTSIHAGSVLPLSFRFSLLPSVLYLNQGVHSQLNIGSMLSVSNLSHSIISHFQGGVFCRVGQDLRGRIHPDAIISILSIQIKGLQLGFSYDITISKLNNNTFGAMELSVGYVFKKKNREVTPYEIPQFQNYEF